MIRFSIRLYIAVGKSCRIMYAEPPILHPNLEDKKVSFDYEDG